MNITPIITEYYPVANKDTNCTHIKVEMYYSLGGWNVFTNKKEHRGYYISISPVCKNGVMESYVAFSGSKVLLKEVERKTKKAQAEAEKMYHESKTYWINTICPDYELA